MAVETGIARAIAREVDAVVIGSPLHLPAARVVTPKGTASVQASRPVRTTTLGTPKRITLLLSEAPRPLARKAVVTTSGAR